MQRACRISLPDKDRIHEYEHIMKKEEQGRSLLVSLQQRLKPNQFNSTNVLKEKQRNV